MDISLKNVRYASRSGVKDLLEESKGCLVMAVRGGGKEIGGWSGIVIVAVSVS